jgi:hypothetical protein
MCHTPDPRPLDALEEKLRAGCALRWRLPPPAVLVRDLQVPHAMALDPPRAGHAAGSWATSSSAPELADVYRHPIRAGIPVPRCLPYLSRPAGCHVGRDGVLVP